MNKKQFIIKTEKGKPDSLKRSVTIVWTITPVQLSGPAHPFDTVQGVSETFNVGSEETAKVALPWRFYFARCTIAGNHAVPDNFCEMDSSRNAVSMTSHGTWSKPYSDAGVHQGSFMATNNSGSAKTIAMCRASSAFVVYRSIENGHSLVVPTSWQFQAYIIDKPVDRRTILQPSELSRPIFTAPISCDALPAESTWILCQDDHGAIRLKNEQYSHLGYPPTTSINANEEPAEEGQQPETVGQPVKKDQLLEVLERLGAVERSIARMQDDYSQGQQAMAAIRNQLAALEKSAATTKEEIRECRATALDQRSDFDRRIAAVEAQATILGRSFDQSQERLSLVHKVVADTQHLLSETEKSANNQLQDFNRRLPIVESRAEKAATSLARSNDRLSALEEFAARTQKDVIAVEKAVHQTQDHVSLVQQLVVASNSQLSMKQTMDRRLPEVEARADKLVLDLGAVQVSVAGLTRQVGVIEARSGDDEVGVGDSTSSSAEGSPVMFPNHLTGEPSAS